MCALPTGPTVMARKWFVWKLSAPRTLSKCRACEERHRQVLLAWQEGKGTIVPKAQLADFREIR